MPYVEIIGWREGFQKIACTHALQRHTELSLATAKAFTDRILDGERIVISVPLTQVAAQLAAELSALGAVAHVVDPEADG